MIVRKEILAEYNGEELKRTIEKYSIIYRNGNSYFSVFHIFMDKSKMALALLLNLVKATCVCVTCHL